MMKNTLSAQKLFPVCQQKYLTRAKEGVKFSMEKYTMKKDKQVHKEKPAQEARTGE